MILYDEIEIEDMDWDDTLLAYTYQCPCGDLFQITKEQLADGEDIARCPSCTLVIQVIYDPDDFKTLDETQTGGTGASGQTAVTAVQAAA